jgi:uncharacterized protein
VAAYSLSRLRGRVGEGATAAPQSPYLVARDLTAERSADALCYISDMMTVDAAIATLRRYESALRARGIRHAAVFGSVARGDNRPDSDLDILVEFEPEAEGSIYEYMRLKDYVAGLFEGPVDVIDRDALKPHLRAPSARDAIYAF